MTVTKDGTTQLGEQRFRCAHCSRGFTRRSTSAFSGRAFPDDIIASAVRYRQCKRTLATWQPLFNEVMVRLCKKGFWNSQPPKDDK